MPCEIQHSIFKTTIFERRKKFETIILRIYASFLGVEIFLLRTKVVVVFPGFEGKRDDQKRCHHCNASWRMCFFGPKFHGKNITPPGSNKHLASPPEYFHIISYTNSIQTSNSLSSPLDAMIPKPKAYNLRSKVETSKEWGNVWWVYQKGSYR